MRVIATAIPDVRIVEFERFDDSRGAFAETYDTAKFYAIGIDTDFVMDAWSVSRRVGTVRGLHFQAPPRGQAKLIRVPRGRLFDVAVDLRRSSPTFGGHVTCELQGGDCRQLFIPAGFAHGFCTLEPDTEIVYKMSAPYASELYGGVLWHDPALGIAWPVSIDEAIVSDKDARLPRLADLGPVFD
jgi:dTDP-4-dehydrorhamnose 3,5-epimerase